LIDEGFAVFNPKSAIRNPQSNVPLQNVSAPYKRPHAGVPARARIPAEDPFPP